MSENTAGEPVGLEKYVSIKGGQGFLLTINLDRAQAEDLYARLGRALEGGVQVKTWAAPAVTPDSKPENADRRE